MVASQEAGGAGLRYGVASMWSPLRRVLVRRPATAAVETGAGKHPRGGMPGDCRAITMTVKA